MKIMKYIAYLTALFLIVGAAYLGNLFFMKPLSIDHYLAKNLIIDYAEAPEGLTYIGIIDRFNWLTNHLSKLSIEDLEDFSDELIKAKERQSLLKSYEATELSKEQQITQKIVLFDLGNQIEQGELFPFHSYPINQIGGLHLNLIEFSPNKQDSYTQLFFLYKSISNYEDMNLTAAQYQNIKRI